MAKKSSSPLARLPSVDRLLTAGMKLRRCVQARRQLSSASRTAACERRRYKERKSGDEPPARCRGERAGLSIAAGQPICRA